MDDLSLNIYDLFESQYIKPHPPPPSRNLPIVAQPMANGICIVQINIFIPR